MKSKKSAFRSRGGAQYHSLRAEKVVPGGDALFRIEGKVVFVPSVLEGECADIEIIHEGKKFSRGRVLQLIETSRHRVEPFCSYYGRCGGCDFQHISYERQLELKTSFVREHFRKFASIELPDDFTFSPSMPREYRNRVQFHNASGGAGFKQRGSDTVISLKSCPVLSRGLNDFLASAGTVRKDREIFFGTGERYWSGREREPVSVTVGGKTIEFRSDLFFQSNLSLLPELIDYALQTGSGEDLKRDHAMDLYCGVGLFSVFLADKYGRVTGVELNRDAEKFYLKNMEGHDHEFFGESLEEWLSRGESHLPDFVIVDPPRTGLSRDVRSFLKEMKLKDLVYVSCDPVTQARDTRDLLEGGYKIVSARGFDFYPQTHHMENVLKFRYQ